MAGFQKVKYSIFCILTTLHLFVASEIAFTQDPPISAAGNVMPPATGVNPNDGITNQQPVTTFYDPATGQQYGRYIIYETVPVASYQQQEVLEKQWVPEWVTENKLTTQTNYTPIVTYQLQLQNGLNLNPFAPSQPKWQYVPVVQYQANNVQVNQPITYQKYVEKEFRKIIPVLKTEQQPRPKYVDRPLNPNGTMVASNPNFPSRPMSSYPNQTVVQPAPAAYYASNSTNGTPVSNLASVPAYNGFNMPAYSGYGSNGWVAQNRVPTNSTPSPQYVNNPNPNSAVANYAYPNPYTNAVAARPPFQLPNFFSRTGSLFQSDWFQNAANSYGANTYVASNPMANTSSWGGTTNWLTNPPFYSGTSGTSGSGVTFRPTSPTANYSTPSSAWNMTPVNNYRDPSQTGIPASVIQ